MNETTLIIGVLGVGKTTLASHATKHYEKAIVITNSPEDFPECTIANDNISIDREGKTAFVSDDFVENEIVIRYAYELGDRLLVIDEAHVYQTSEQLLKVIRYSRHKNLDVVLVSHSFFDFARLNRHLIHNVIVMKMTDDEGRGEPFELNYLDRLSPESKIREIRKYEFALVKGNLPKWLKTGFEKSGDFFRLNLKGG